MTTAISKRMKEAKSMVEQSKFYKLQEAVAILKQAPQTKFDQSVDISIKLNLDLKEKPQPVRGTVILPHGTGKTIKVAVFCKEKDTKVAKDAGADYIGDADLIQKVNSGFLDFNIAIATPEMMKDLAKLGKILGPRGLMPTPKVGTVTNDIANAVKEVKKGKIEFKMDKTACINMAVSKISFEEKAICENVRALIEAIKQNKPSQVKGQFIRNVSLSTTIGPGIRLDASEYK